MIALLGPQRGVDSWQCYRALELADEELKFSSIVVLEYPQIIRDVAYEYAHAERLNFRVIPVDQVYHGSNAHVAALWELMRFHVEHVVMVGPRDTQFHNAKTLMEWYHYPVIEFFK